MCVWHGRDTVLVPDPWQPRPLSTLSIYCVIFSITVYTTPGKDMPGKGSVPIP